MKPFLLTITLACAWTTIISTDAPLHARNLKYSGLICIYNQIISYHSHNSKDTALHGFWQISYCPSFLNDYNRVWHQQQVSWHRHSQISLQWCGWIQLLSFSSLLTYMQSIKFKSLYGCDNQLIKGRLKKQVSIISRIYRVSQKKCPFCSYLSFRPWEGCLQG